MLTASVCSIGVFFSAYLFTLLISNVLSIKNDVSIPYQFKKDPYIYIFLLLLVLFVGIASFVPDFRDIILPINPLWLGLSFLFAALIYVLFLLEADTLLDLGVFFLSVLSTFLFANHDALVDLAPVPWQLSALGIGLFIGLITLGARVLAGLTGIFSLVITLCSIGLFLTAVAGGIPFYLGLMAAAVAGTFACVFQFNHWGMRLKINEGVMMSVTFLFCMLLLAGTNELAGPSMFILVLYIPAELFWSLWKQYILRHKEPDLYFNSVYFNTFEKGVDLSTIHVLVLKISTVNTVFALFQLYAQNAFTLPVLVFIIDFWLLSKMNSIGTPAQSIKEINQEFIQNIKNEIKDIKQTFTSKD